MKFSHANILSEHIGRSFTLLITLFFLALTASALISGGGITRRETIRICVLDRDSACSLPERYADLKKLMSDAAGLPVSVTRTAAVAGDGFDLCIVPVFDWLLASDRVDGTPIFSLGSRADTHSESLVIARRKERAESAAEISTGELLFAHPRSVHGFWNQLSLLKENGLQPPAHLDSFNFAGGAERACERAVAAVVSRRFRYGACCAGALAELERAGLIDGEAIEIVARSDALPDLLIVSTPDGAKRYREILNAVRARLLKSAAQNPESNADLVIEELPGSVVKRLQSIEELIGSYRRQL
jgi:ABC-type phosphate/phosphonate transport system substrate-binding protein